MEHSQEDEEDDYLTMTFDEPVMDPRRETLTQRKKRLAKEAEARRTKSKAQIADEARARRETGLNKTSMDTNSKAFKMMERLGYKPGTALGATKPPAVQSGMSRAQNEVKDERLLEPIGLEMREGRSGIGADAEKKRKFREEVERIKDEDKRRKVEEGDFRERQMKERDDRKKEGQMWGAMKVAERLDEEDETSHDEANGTPRTRRTKPLQGVNVLWRALIRDRLITERDKRMRYDLHQSLSRLPTYNDPSEEEEDKIALARKDRLEEVDFDLDQEDSEMDAFEALPVDERLEKLVIYLREKRHYCFWCKHRYPDKRMEGCPGVTEDDHD